MLLPFSSVQFSHSVVSDSLRPHESQHTRPPCPSPSPWVYSNSCPLSRWCHPTISSSVFPFSSHFQSFPSLTFYLFLFYWFRFLFFWYRVYFSSAFFFFFLTRTFTGSPYVGCFTVAVRPRGGHTNPTFPRRNFKGFVDIFLNDQSFSMMIFHEIVLTSLPTLNSFS